jgi:hypothetical protein
VQDEPHPPEILQGVADFLRSVVVPQTTGAIAYQARIAAAALDLVRRQLERSGFAADEQGRLRALLDQDGPLSTLTAELARRIGAARWIYPPPAWPRISWLPRGESSPSISRAIGACRPPPRKPRHEF